MTNDKRAATYARQRGVLQADGRVTVPSTTGGTYGAEPSLWNARRWATSRQLRRLHRTWRKPQTGDVPF